MYYIVRERGRHIQLDCRLRNICVEKLLDADVSLFIRVRRIVYLLLVWAGEYPDFVRETTGHTKEHPRHTARSLGWLKHVLAPSNQRLLALVSYTIGAVIIRRNKKYVPSLCFRGEMYRPRVPVRYEHEAFDGPNDSHSPTRMFFLTEHDALD